MKLIDADRLKDTLSGDTKLHDLLAKVIDAEPPVKAVPTEAVEWYNRVMRNDNRAYDWDKVVRMWQKSKEPQKDDKKYLTAEQAIELLPDDEWIHTFYNESFGLIGADWERDEIVKKLKGSQRIELTGENARKIGHGIAAYDEGSEHSDVLFIQTDEDKLNAFDPIRTVKDYFEGDDDERKGSG